jgi:hypothetical protein
MSGLKAAARRNLWRHDRRQYQSAAGTKLLGFFAEKCGKAGQSPLLLLLQGRFAVAPGIGSFGVNARF